MTALNRKLARDLWRMKGQALAIAAVIATGVLLLVMQSGLVTSLEETRRAYYERYRLAEIFAPVNRAPLRLVDALAEIPGVAAVTGRISGSGRIDLENEAVPIRTRVLSLPPRGEPDLNHVHLAEGQRLDPSRPEEVLLLNGFAKAHGLEPGDRIITTINGLRREFRIAGLAMSPEFLYTPAPGEIFAEDGRYAVIWMSTAAAAASFDMEGAFNEALLGLERGAAKEPVIDAVDRILDAYGNQGAYGLEELVSNRFITEEIAGLRATNRTVPPVFLAVAAFLLYIVVTRIIQSEREEIGLMKAFGYSAVEIGLHYLQFVLAIAVAGAIMGCGFGILGGHAMTGLYLHFFKFPFLVFRLDPASFATGFAFSIAAASAGGFIALRRIFSLTPADAMRPPTPPDYSRAGRLAARALQVFDQPTRMVARRLLRQPWRMGGAVAGIACAMALSSAMASIVASYDQILDLNFAVIDRSDLSVTFTNPVSDQAIYELRRLPGMIEVEPVRAVPAILRHGRQSYRGAVEGLTSGARLYRAVDTGYGQIEMPERGIVLSPGLSQTLKIDQGETITIDVREGRQPSIRVPVAAIAETLLGSPSYMRMATLNRLLDETGRVSGAYMRVDPDQAETVYARLKEMPNIAGVNRKVDTRASMKKLMDQGAGAMRYVMLVIAGVITIGVIYNTARIAQAERARDLASLRVIGFTRNETAFVLLGELAVVTLVALPIGSLGGYFLSYAIAAGFSTDLYQIPVTFTPASHGAAALAVVISAIVSGWLVKRDIDRADLVAALKTRE